MPFQDRSGLALTGSNAGAVTFLDSALNSLLLLRDDPMAQVNLAIAADNRLVMAHALKGILCVLSTEHSLLPLARGALAAGQTLAIGATSRERTHLQALECWINGQLNQANACWESILIDHPDDALAMFAAHQTDFFLGHSSELRDRVARRLPELSPGTALHGHYSAMYAFGLEEMGDYQAAEMQGRAALEINPDDIWAVHAVAHVMEMNNRIDDGIEWIQSSAGNWSARSFFSGHLWWHQALYFFDRQQWTEVLRLYDERIRRNDSAVVMDLLDASALLWRLRLHEVDVGDRWRRISELWEPHLADGWSAFNDYHAMMSFVCAGRDDLARSLLEVMERASHAETDNAVSTRAVGLPVARAFHACSEGRYGEAVTLLLPLKAIAARAGGSHAQRDLLAQTLISAAQHSGQHKLARSLLNERLALKPQSTLNQVWSEQIIQIKHNNPIDQTKTINRLA